jgi:hypothetical protein
MRYIEDDFLIRCNTKVNRGGTEEYEFFEMNVSNLQKES